MHLGLTYLAHAPRARARIASLDQARPEEAIAEAEASLAAVAWFDPRGVAEWLVRSPRDAAIALAILGDRPHTLVGERLAELFPELAGLAVPPAAATHEHDVEATPDRSPPTPLLDHVFRALRIAASLPEVATFDPAHRSLVTTVLLFADVAKGGTEVQRRDWLVRLGVDGAVHNEDSAVILRDALSGTLGQISPFRDRRFAHRAEALVAATGLVGMHLRGEVGHDALGAVHRLLRDGIRDDADRRLLARVFSIVNHCDTAAVRQGLWSEALAAEFRRVEETLFDIDDVEEMRELDLAERIARFRHGALVEDARILEVKAALGRLGVARERTIARLARCRAWYAEAALGALSLEASVRLLALVAGVAEGCITDLSRPWHLDLLGIVGTLRDGSGARREYPVRLLEAILAATSDDDLLRGRLPSRALVSFPARKGGQEAVLMRLDLSDEARAILTLLPIYERKEAAAFHASLKALCDLYGLRKDDFDRVANEASYLATMNAARSDKARMIDLVVPGLVVEVGPGGGVVLDLLEERSPTGRIVGLDASSAVVEALTKRRLAEGRRWEVMHGDAFRLEGLFGPGTVSTVVLCALLHEIFSYVPWSDPPGTPPRKFQLASVDALVAASFRALRPGGRIVIRDGVMPRHEPRELEFLDPSWREGLTVFAERYEARRIVVEELSKTRVRLDAADLFEFLTTWTWGPSAFPYEIREQRAVLPRAEYVARLLDVCNRADPPHRAHEVAVPRDLASYLQPGYPAGVRPHLRIFDVAGNEVPMPDVNGVWVIEKA